MTSKQKAVTAHGEVEYETVECASCESEVMKEQALQFLLVDTDRIRSFREWSDHNSWEVYDDGYDVGWACPYCADEGPVDYPSNCWGNGLSKDQMFIAGAMFGMAFIFLLVVIL